LQIPEAATIVRSRRLSRETLAADGKKLRMVVRDAEIVKDELR
jgi:hypothetical protein